MKKDGQTLPKLIENIQTNKMWQFNPGYETHLVFGKAGIKQVRLCVYPNTKKYCRMPLRSSNVLSVLRLWNIRLVLRILPGVRQDLHIARGNTGSDQA